MAAKRYDLADDIRVFDDGMRCTCKCCKSAADTVLSMVQLPRVCF